MGRVAFLFPGQGSQSPGMGRELFDAEPAAREAWDEMETALGESLAKLCFEGSAEQLALTENTQPAVLACSVAAWRCLRRRGVDCDAVAGHSLGEYSALVAAGALGAGDAVRTVRQRGRYMQEAVPVGVGAMAALLGLDRAVVEDVCRAARREGEVLSPANYNAPGQVVVAGHRAAVERAIEEAGRRGGRRSVLLPVSAPFHCELMRPAAAALATDLTHLTFHPLGRPLVTNVTAREVEDATAVPALLERQVVAPVLWEDSMRRLAEMGVNTFVEAGPGRVLAGLAKRTVKDARILPASTPGELDAVAAALT